MRVLAATVLVVLAALSQARPGTAQACDLAAKDVRQAGPGCAAAWVDANVRLNEIQAVGTSESYKLQPSREIISLLKMGSEEDAEALEYEQPPIAAQLESGARSLVFDVAYDPKGGLYKFPAGASMAGELVSDDYVAAMATPGFKVIHVLDIDFKSSCATLGDCLKAVADWSHANPRHLPIIISLRTNDEPTPMPGATKPHKFDAAAFEALEAEVRAAFRPDELITPRLVQGGFPTLREAVLAGNWPRIGAVRGKVLVLLDDSKAKVALYRSARMANDGPAMFIATDENSPDAAFLTIDNPARNSNDIIERVKAGFIVHTFADADTREARKNDHIRRDWAFASGAQVISTDFLKPDRQIGAYQVRVPAGHVAQCNVQLESGRCGGLDLEAPEGAAPVVGRAP
ncbi:MAG: Ca2+-dependent phosphoinositide-specific phospholipase C [Alphaproteobacteria bacterium]